jgi:hypothetical protein
MPAVNSNLLILLREENKKIIIVSSGFITVQITQEDTYTG